MGVFSVAVVMAQPYPVTSWQLHTDMLCRSRSTMSCALCRDALLCWERMNGQPVFGRSVRISLRFCASEPADPRADWRQVTSSPTSTRGAPHVCVLDVCAFVGVSWSLVRQAVASCILKEAHHASCVVHVCVCVQLA